MHHVNEYVVRLLAERGVIIKACYFCPHLPEKAAVPAYEKICTCRKPLPGMLLQAAEEYNIDVGKSIMLGDDVRDLQAGRAAGCEQVVDVADVLKITS
jgi:D-glycero-D-manno-heptose 1,7-bisphosphate phosphatase